jgi:hypothetical protein
MWGIYIITISNADNLGVFVNGIIRARSLLPRALTDEPY